MPKVSVIIPTVRGREELLKRAVNSVLNQTFQDFEVIIVSNGPIDYYPNDSRVRVLELPKSNVSQARNYGIKNASGEYIAFLDDDDEWLPEKLEKQIALLSSNLEITLCYANYYRVHPNGTRVIYHAEPCEGDCYEKLKRKNFIGTSTVVVRRKILLRVGLFDEELTFAEDWDLWLRISSKRFKFGYIREPLAIYRVNENKTKYCLYFDKFPPFILKWADKLDKKVLTQYVLMWLWYGRKCGKLSSVSYWLYKVQLISGMLNPSSTIKDMSKKIKMNKSSYLI